MESYGKCNITHKNGFYTFIIAINYKTRKNINEFAELTKNRS